MYVYLMNAFWSPLSGKKAFEKTLRFINNDILRLPNGGFL